MVLSQLSTLAQLGTLAAQVMLGSLVVDDLVRASAATSSQADRIALARAPRVGCRGLHG